jgi:hypothetical protein
VMRAATGRSRAAARSEAMLKEEEEYVAEKSRGRMDLLFDGSAGQSRSGVNQATDLTACWNIITIQRTYYNNPKSACLGSNCSLEDGE